MDLGSQFNILTSKARQIRYFVAKREQWIASAFLSRLRDTMGLVVLDRCFASAPYSPTVFCSLLRRVRLGVVRYHKHSLIFRLIEIEYAGGSLRYVAMAFNQCQWLKEVAISVKNFKTFIGPLAV